MTENIAYIPKHLADKIGCKDGSIVASMLFPRSRFRVVITTVKKNGEPETFIRFNTPYDWPPYNADFDGDSLNFGQG